MKIFVVNRGSSTLKLSLYQLEDYPADYCPPMWQKELSLDEDLRSVLEQLPEIDIIGHRIVHGGREYRKSILIDDQVKRTLHELSSLAPLHNPPALEEIKRLEKLMQGKPHIAVFDTAFHHTMPLRSTLYPLAYKWYEEGIQRFGFHGISFQYCARRATLFSSGKKMVICHLGSGASLCALYEGKSVDTTMGFTPLEGLMMDTRSGSIDPGVVLYLAKKMNNEELSDELYFQSGLLGISGISGEMRQIMEKMEGDKRAKTAFDLYLHQLNSQIGSMIASLQGIDTIVFTGGIGEHAALLRQRVSDCFSFLGMKIDKGKNQVASGEDQDLSASDSKVQVLLIHTQEAFEIARECWKVCSEFALPNGYKKFQKA